ncbi:hypothetical protein BH09VER1_BH09VER1_25110 [soil metagenome]
MNLPKNLLVVAFTLCALVPAKSAALLSYWNFNNDSPTYATTLGSFSTTAAAYGEKYVQSSNSVPGVLLSNSANSTVFSGTAIKIDFSNIATITNPTINGKTPTGYTTQNGTGGAAGYGVFADSTVNQAGTDSTTGGSLLLLNTTGGMLNKYITFSLSSVGYDTLSLTYATRLTSSVTASQVWTYSTDGTNFFSLTTISPAANATFISESLNLSSLSSNALNNQSTFYLRMTYTSANSQGSQAFDNFQLTGVSSVPEPGTISLALGGLGLAFGYFRRNLRGKA